MAPRRDRLLIATVLTLLLAGFPAGDGAARSAGSATRSHPLPAIAAGQGGGGAVSPTPSPSPLQTPSPGPPAVPTLGASNGPAGSITKTGSAAVALTFDDGPAGNTGQVLDLLKQYSIHATFCIVGQMISGYSANLIRRMVAEGHTLCNHTWTHDLNLRIRSEAQIRSELQRTNDAIHAIVPAAPIRYFRRADDPPTAVPGTAPHVERRGARGRRLRDGAAGRPVPRTPGNPVPRRRKRGSSHAAATPHPDAASELGCGSSSTIRG